MGGQIVAQNMYNLMTSVQTPAGSMVAYGFAFFIDSSRGQPRIWQDGSTPGFNVTDQYYRKQRTRILVFTNNNDGSSYADALGEKITRFGSGPDWPESPSVGSNPTRATNSSNFYEDPTADYVVGLS
jgi:hypothetical protein